MTLNEARDRLMKSAPGRSVCVSAECWYHHHTRRTETEFDVTIGAGRDFGALGPDLDVLLSQAAAWIAKNNGTAEMDQPAVVEVDQ